MARLVPVLAAAAAVLASAAAPAAQAYSLESPILTASPATPGPSGGLCAGAVSPGRVRAALARYYRPGLQHGRPRLETGVFGAGMALVLEMHDYRFRPPGPCVPVCLVRPTTEMADGRPAMISARVRRLGAGPFMPWAGTPEGGVWVNSAGMPLDPMRNLDVIRDDRANVTAYCATFAGGQRQGYSQGFIRLQAP